MRKMFWRPFGALLAVGLALIMAACQSTPDKTPSPTVEAMTVEEYLASPERDALLREPIDNAGIAINRALKAGTITSNDASVTLDGKHVVELAIKPNEQYPSGMTIKAPSKEQSGSLWVITFDGHASTIIVAGHETAREVKVHDLSSLDALEKFVVSLN